MNDIIWGDNVAVMKKMKEGCIDLTVTSPPYDDLRTYNNNIDKTWGEDVWKPIIEELYRVTKKGGVVVWVVGDKTHKGSESGTSFKQALWFMECGFKLHDTMIWVKDGGGAIGSNKTYIQNFEYMFVFSKDKINNFNLIYDKLNMSYGKNKGKENGAVGRRTQNGEHKIENRKPAKEFSRRNNWWYIPQQSGKHPAVFPEQLAEDHILSWSNENDIIFDPFVGSGTTPKMAKKLGRRYIGIDISEEYCELAINRIKTLED